MYTISRCGSVTYKLAMYSLQVVSQVWYPFFFIYSIMSAKKAHFGVRTEPNKGHEKRSFVLKRVANPGRAG